SRTHCVLSTGAWNLYVDQAFLINCDQQFTLILTEELDNFITPLKETSEHTLRGRNLVAVPQTGMWIHKRSCTGRGSVTFATGAGPDANDNEVMYRSWLCEEVPDWVFSFDIVITIDADDGVVYTIDCSSDKKPVKAQSGNAVAIYTSGISNNLQNLQLYNNIVHIKIGDGGTFNDINVNMHLKFDSKNNDFSLFKIHPINPCRNISTGHILHTISSRMIARCAICRRLCY
ncbi:hypothetical protein PENTCL1PPCAC_25326, partial [Pristionchus entomophagus]